jgi:hypothetical protein
VIPAEHFPLEMRLQQLEGDVPGKIRLRRVCLQRKQALSIHKAFDTVSHRSTPFFVPSETGAALAPMELFPRARGDCCDLKLPAHEESPHGLRLDLRSHS